MNILIMDGQGGRLGSLLVEVGGHGNTLEEALAAGRLAAKGLAAALGA